MQNRTFPLVMAIIFLTSAMPAHAYLDPGTGTLIVQSLIGGAAAALTVAGVYITKIRSGFSRLFNRSAADKTTEPRS